MMIVTDWRQSLFKQSSNYNILKNGWIVILITLTTMMETSGKRQHGRAVVNISVDEQVARITTERARCLATYLSDSNLTINSQNCPAVWDDLLCWPETPPNTVAVQACPNYVELFKPWENASRQCLENGSWFFDSVNNRTWTDLTACLDKDYSDPPGQSPHFIKSHMGRIQLMYNVGYGLSLASLVLSICIMVGFKKLHCSRNTIHMNLFLSFILRASFSFMKENLLVEGLGFPSDVIQTGVGGGVIFKTGIMHWECKLFFTLFHYILGANYMWIFAEALYLHMIISVAVFSDRGSTKWYILLGWVSPVVFVVPWIIVRATMENIYCWNTHPTPGYFWIMRGPIVFSIVVNFVFFLNIVRVLFTKLNAVNSPEAKKFRYRKLAKSTLVLIPLFGIHYIIFAGLPKDVNQMAELIQLYFEMFFNSVQGFFVAILFCFMNGEVQSEIKKKWQRFRITRFHHLPQGRNNSHNLTYSTYLSRQRESNASVTQIQEAGDNLVNNGFKRQHSSLKPNEFSMSLLTQKLGSQGLRENSTYLFGDHEKMTRETSLNQDESQTLYNAVT
ncbi:unnamed protein product [Lymnaea stagnalis]|uniref:Cluster B receptor 2 n=1 Tax=Lymnaea stagnalis TaxID=6523 RepID=A0AA96T018_LYMST|nr:cluster B receptor 2 [Lymnaea stagnalis]